MEIIQKIVHKLMQWIYDMLFVLHCTSYLFYFEE